MHESMDYTDRLKYAMRLAGLDPARPEHVGLLASSIDATYQAAKKAIDGTTKKLAADNNVKASRMQRWTTTLSLSGLKTQIVFAATATVLC